MLSKLKRKVFVGVLTCILVLSACSLSNSPVENNDTEDKTTVEADSAKAYDSALLEIEFDFKRFRDAYYDHSFEIYDCEGVLFFNDTIDECFV